MTKYILAILVAYTVLITWAVLDTRATMQKVFRSLADFELVDDGKSRCVSEQDDPCMKKSEWERLYQ